LSVELEKQLDDELEEGFTFERAYESAEEELNLRRRYMLSYILSGYGR